MRAYKPTSGEQRTKVDIGYRSGAPRSQMAAWNEDARGVRHHRRAEPSPGHHGVCGTVAWWSSQKEALHPATRMSAAPRIPRGGWGQTLQNLLDTRGGGGQRQKTRPAVSTGLRHRFVVGVPNNATFSHQVGSARAGQNSCWCIAPGPDIGGSVSDNRVAGRTGALSSGGES